LGDDIDTVKKGTGNIIDDNKEVGPAENTGKTVYKYYHKMQGKIMKQDS
jgi:hypothetical protein